MPVVSGSDPARCPVCGEVNDCQQCTSVAYKGPCWCEQHTFPEELLKKVPPEARHRACICRNCVEAAWRQRPSPKAVAGDFYFDPASGLLVFTGQYLRRRGYCCHSGCRHCPWEPQSPTAPVSSSMMPSLPSGSARIAGVALLLWALGLDCAWTGPLRAASFTETFATDPAGRGWHPEGAAELFAWDAAAQHLDVTWDSAQPQSFFALPLGTTLGVRDSFAFGLDLVLTDAEGGVHPPRTGAMQVAFGLLDLNRAAGQHYPRAAGKAFDLVEFNWFPSGEFPGFGVVDPTVSPAAFGSGGQVAASFTFPLELATGVTHRIRCVFQPADRTLVTTLVSDGVAIPVQPVVLSASFIDFSLNALAIINWNEADSPFDSLLAHGYVDNVTWERPDPPIGSIAMTSEGVVEFLSQRGWQYYLEASGDLLIWSRLSAAVGTGDLLWLADPRDAFFQTQFYRVQAEQE